MFFVGLISVDINKVIDEKNVFWFNGVFDVIDNYCDFKDGECYVFNFIYIWYVGEDICVVVFYEYVNDDWLVDRGVLLFNGVLLEGYDNIYFGDFDFNNMMFEVYIVRVCVDYSFF